MPSIADTVAQVQAAGVPALFADTCILLDVIRAPQRPFDLPGCIDAAWELLDLVATPPLQCTLVVASFVPEEWLKHAGPLADRLRNLLTETDAEAGRLHGFCGLVGVIPPFPTTEYRTLALPDRLHDLSRQLLDRALPLEPDHDCIIRAYERAVNLTPPSREGKVRDATIIEECLEVSRRLRAAGFARKRVFCTSNTNDYCERGSRLHPLLAVDFGAAGLEFATNLPWAVNTVNKP